MRAIRRRLESEVLVGPAFKPGPRRAVLLYPSPYRAGMSSLGYQQILRVLREAGWSVERAFLPDDPDAYRRSRRRLVSYETGTPLNSFPIIGVSLAYELELAGLITALELGGVPVLREQRCAQDPRVIIGGPLTFSNPLPASPFCEAMLLGEAEESVIPAFEAALGEDFLHVVEGLPGGFVPTRRDTLPPVGKASDALLPARSMILSPEAELSDMFLLEGERGCHRQCTFCVMRRSTNGGMRLVTPEHLLSLIPDEAQRVGLVGAAISDHPKLVDLLAELVRSGREIGISSLRADRVALKPRIASPIPRPIPDKRFAPKMRTTMKRMIASSGRPSGPRSAISSVFMMTPPS